MQRIGELLATEDPWRGPVRALGGLLLGAGLLVVFVRRSLLGDPWGELALAGVLVAAAVLLYGVGMLGARTTGERAPWQPVFLIFGTLVIPAALLQLLTWAGGDAGASLNIAWILALTAAAAAIAAGLGGVRYGLLLAALATIVAWLALWDGILADGVFEETGTLRVLLVAIGVGLLAAGAWARQLGGADGAERRGAELITGGALAAVGAGAISAGALVGGLAFGPLASAGPTVLWDAYLLAVSLGALVLAAALAIRGLAYVGAAGLAVFVLVVGFDLDEPRPEGAVIGWPLLVLALGAIAFVVSLIRLVEVPEEGSPEDGDPDPDAAGEGSAETGREPAGGPSPGG